MQWGKNGSVVLASGRRDDDDDAGETWADGADWMPTRLDVGRRTLCVVWTSMYGRASDGRSNHHAPTHLDLSVDLHLLVEKPGLPTGNLGTCCVVACAAAPSQRDGDIYNHAGMGDGCGRLAGTHQLLLNVEQALPAGGLPDVQMSERAACSVVGGAVLLHCDLPTWLRDFFVGLS